jgi:hypothetical protein
LKYATLEEDEMLGVNKRAVWKVGFSLIDILAVARISLHVSVIVTIQAYSDPKPPNTTQPDVGQGQYKKVLPFSLVLIHMGSYALM